MDEMWFGYRIEYRLVPKQSDQGRISTYSLRIVGINEQDVVNNAKPYFELAQVEGLRRTKAIDSNFEGYDVEVKKVTKIPFLLQVYDDKPRFIGAFAYLGKGLLRD